MLLHYIRISLRNLNKYKTQTAISIVSMAVSMMLLAVVAAFLLSIKPSPLLSLPYADRVEQLVFGDDPDSQYISKEEMSLITGHQFKNAEDIHFSDMSGNAILARANADSKDERSISSRVRLGDKEYLKFLGMKSVYSGKQIEPFSQDETVIDQRLARKLFGKENPIGKKLDVHFYYWGNVTDFDKSWVIKDVMENPSPADDFLYSGDNVYITDYHLQMTKNNTCYFVLREGSSREALAEELREILPDKEVVLLHVKEYYSDKTSVIIRNSIILFLFLFLLVSFSNYLRQQTQLFRLREREVALRTCVGSQPGSLFSLFSTEILIVLTLTLVLTLALIYAVEGFLISRHINLFEIENYNFDEAIPIAIVSTVILIIISIAVVALTVRRIRRDQTGLALRMKPRPKHRLRNVGLTVQMSVCVLFTWITVLFFMSTKSIKEYYGIPEDIDRYKNCLQMSSMRITQDQVQQIYSKIKSLESVEKIYRLMDFQTAFMLDSDRMDYFTYSEYRQNDEDALDFYGMKNKIKDIQPHANPDKYILVSEEFKQKLIDKGLWNGKTVKLPYTEEYDVKGIIDPIPFRDADNGRFVVVYDAPNPFYGDVYDRIVMPKPGKVNETRDAINAIISEVMPGRMDVKVESFYDLIAERYNLLTTMITIIYILSAISVVTSMAAVYAGVSLDTRRRRKEMALRKLNGAGPKVIAMIFVRTYMVIIAVAALIALPIGFIVITKIREFDMLSSLNTDSIVITFLLALLLIIAVTTLTIAWKIRNVMTADPIEYLKE